MYYSINDEKIYMSHSEIRMNHKDISMPATLADEFLTSFGYEVVFDVPQPTVGELEVAYQDGTEIDSKGNRVIKWTIRDIFSDTEEATKAEHEATYLLAKFKATVPKTITPRQVRLVLLDVGLLDDIEVLLATDKAMQIWWEYSLEVDRDNAHIVTAGTTLGLTELQLDEMFIAASKL